MTVLQRRPGGRIAGAVNRVTPPRRVRGTDPAPKGRGKRSVSNMKIGNKAGRATIFTPR